MGQTLSNLQQILGQLRQIHLLEVPDKRNYLLRIINIITVQVGVLLKYTYL